MRFCPECESVMVKTPSDASGIKFQCSCGIAVEGNDDDTLMYAEYMNMSNEGRQYETFIRNSSKDPAGNIVNRQCGACGLPFMTMIRIGESETTIYTCRCGA